MSLVAYDSSDDEKEEEIFKTQSLQTINSKNSSVASVKRQRECVKITIPSLKEFEEEESPLAPKKQKSQSGSGLFSLLPPPKNTPILKKSNFVPHILSSKKGAPQSVSKSCISKTTETDKSGVLEKNYESDTSLNEETSHDEGNSAACKDFFSLEGLSSCKKLDDTKCLSPNYSLETNSSLATPEAYNSIQNKPSSIPSCHPQQENLYVQPFHSQEESENSEPVTLVQSEELNLSINQSTNNVTDINNEKSLLSDKEFLKLQGRRREFDAVDIIDVNADDQLTDRNEWLMKSLTEESTHRPSKKKHNMPTQQQKRKHQITYLAFQAKEREMDLKNQWALNSRTRRETQAKYGF